ncbi:uncharacterized protein CDAR_22621 [Caerostris darwini]|uniref:Uncharacterized protein n=1 Tax=Caerostris darwini TaxID=1538125 RepID=A0AAV4V8P1_9ARAC|nr:uncharacterized protein CDAR_22621 [Caerostris darwini]
MALLFYLAYAFVVCLLPNVSLGEENSTVLYECRDPVITQCPCGVEGNFQEVYVPSCEVNKSNDSLNCKPCPRSCDIYNLCKTCSKVGCVTCPSGRSGRFCENTELLNINYTGTPTVNNKYYEQKKGNASHSSNLYLKDMDTIPNKNTTMENGLNFSNNNSNVFNVSKFLASSLAAGDYFVNNGTTFNDSKDLNKFFNNQTYGINISPVHPSENNRLAYKIIEVKLNHTNNFEKNETMESQEKLLEHDLDFQDNESMHKPLTNENDNLNYFNDSKNSTSNFEKLKTEFIDSSNKTDFAAAFLKYRKEQIEKPEFSQNISKETEMKHPTNFDVFNMSLAKEVNNPSPEVSEENNKTNAEKNISQTSPLLAGNKDLLKKNMFRITVLNHGSNASSETIYPRNTNKTHHGTIEKTDLIFNDNKTLNFSSIVLNDNETAVPSNTKVTFLSALPEGKYFVDKNRTANKIDIKENVSQISQIEKSELLKNSDTRNPSNSSMFETAIFANKDNITSLTADSVNVNASKTNTKAIANMKFNKAMANHNMYVPNKYQENYKAPNEDQYNKESSQKLLKEAPDLILYKHEISLDDGGFQKIKSNNVNSLEKSVLMPLSFLQRSKSGYQQSNVNDAYQQNLCKFYPYFLPCSFSKQVTKEPHVNNVHNFQSLPNMFETLDTSSINFKHPSSPQLYYYAPERHTSMPSNIVAHLQIFGTPKAILSINGLSEYLKQQTQSSKNANNESTAAKIVKGLVNNFISLIFAKEFGTHLVHGFNEHKNKPMKSLTKSYVSDLPTDFGFKPIPEEVHYRFNKPADYFKTNEESSKLADSQFFENKEDKDSTSSEHVLEPHDSVIGKVDSIRVLLNIPPLFHQSEVSSHPTNNNKWYLYKKESKRSGTKFPEEFLNDFIDIFNRYSKCKNSENCLMNRPTNEFDNFGKKERRSFKYVDPMQGDITKLNEDKITYNNKNANVSQNSNNAFSKSLRNYYNIYKSYNEHGDKIEIPMQHKLPETYRILIIEGKDVKHYVNFSDDSHTTDLQQAHSRTKRATYDGGWCPINKRTYNGNLDCTIWTYQKICRITCHPGFSSKHQEFRCSRRNHNWQPELDPCTFKKQHQGYGYRQGDIDVKAGESTPMSKEEGIAESGDNTKEYSGKKKNKEGKGIQSLSGTIPKGNKNMSASENLNEPEGKVFELFEKKKTSGNFSMDSGKDYDSTEAKPISEDSNGKNSEESHNLFESDPVQETSEEDVENNYPLYKSKHTESDLDKEGTSFEIKSVQ